PVLDVSSGMVTGLGFIQFIIAAIPALAAAGMSIANGIIGSKDAKKIQGEQEQVAQLQQKQAAETQQLTSQLQVLQASQAAQTRNLVIYGLAGVAGIVAVGYGLKRVLRK